VRALACAGVCLSARARVRRTRTREGSQVAVAEWWVHKRARFTTGHRLHFDTDEESFERSGGRTLRHPLYSAVLFLTEVVCGTVRTVPQYSQEYSQVPVCNAPESAVRTAAWVLLNFRGEVSINFGWKFPYCRLAAPGCTVAYHRRIRMGPSESRSFGPAAAQCAAQCAGVAGRWRADTRD
jgi:hypothetical protein